MIDEELLSKYSIKENDCIVCMLTKPKKQPQQIKQPETKEEIKPETVENISNQQQETTNTESKKEE